MVLYLAVAIVLVGLFFVKTLDGVDSFIPGNDATTHLNMIQSFLDTGDWSVLSGGYYPKGWAGLAAMVAQALSINAPFAVNILDTVILCAIYPLSMLGFLSCCFSKRPTVITCGAVCTLAFAAFPWNFLPLNLLGPNLIGFSLVPVGLLFLMLLIRQGMSKSARTSLAIALFAFGASNVFSHPSALFAAGVFAIPLTVYYVLTCESEKLFPRNRTGFRRRLIAVGGFIAFVVVAWAACYSSPFLSSTVSFEWPAWASPRDGIKSVLTLSFADNPAQWLTAAIVFIGILYTLWRRQYLWITLGFVFFCVMFAFDISADGLIKQILTGFWYTSIRRLAAAACIMGVPLLAMGCYVSIRVLQNVLHANVGERFMAVFRKAIPLFVLGCFAAVNFCPNFSLIGPSGQVMTTFGYLSGTLADQNNIESNWVLDKAERNFLHEVKMIVGDEAVFNVPCDGSAYAYCLEQIHVINKNYFLDTDPESTTLRDHMSEIADSGEVQQAAKNLGVRYLLFLDYGLGEDSTIYTNMFDESKWEGALSVTDDTPGFETVLAQGDMRLCKITCVG